MHELSIAQGILDIAVKEKEKAGAVSITEIELEIGRLAGVDYPSFNFALETLMATSGMSKVKVIVHKPDGGAVCEDCGFEFGINTFATPCPSCLSYRCQVKQGKELRLKSIMVE